LGRVKLKGRTADGSQVDPAAIPPRPLGLLLLQRGVLTAAQLEQVLAEQQRSGRSLAEIIIGRGFAEHHALERALAGGSGTAPTSGEGPSQPNNVIAFANSSRGGQSPERGRAEEDAEWRRKLFDLAEEARDEPAESPRARPRAPRGIRGKLARYLEAYLARTAAELDERGEALERRSIALEQALQRVAEAEAALDQRVLRLRELDLAGEGTANQIDELLELIAEREASLEEISNERDDVRQELELAQAGLTRAHGESAERDRLLSSTEQRVAELLEEVEQKKAARQIAERNLAQREEMLAKLEAANEAQISDLATMRGALTQARAESADRDRRIHSGEQQAAAFAEELERLRARLQNVEGDLAHRDEMLAKLEAANEVQTRDLEALRSTLGERTARVSEVERKLEDTEAALSATQRKLQYAEHQSAELASSAEQRQREAARRDAVVAELQARLEEERGRQQEYEDQLQRLRRDEGEREAALSRAVAESAERQRLLLASDKRADALAEQLEAVRVTLGAADGGERGTVTAERENAQAASGVTERTTHLCFVPLGGSYTLVERFGPLPKRGDQVSDPEHPGLRFVVSRVGRSPLPLDERMCAYLQALD
jgi:DNA repair exonuclease SbcCD ATPase subunit